MSTNLSFFETCVSHALANKELVSEFDRLQGTNLSNVGSPIVLAVDKASGRQSDDMQKFMSFVYKYIYIPLVEECVG